MIRKTRVPATLASIGLLASIIALSFITPCDGMTEAAKNISKREAQLVDIIEHHSLSFDIEKFAKDPILVQSGSYVRYSNPKAKSEANKVVLSKKHPDYGKDSVVLSSEYNRFAIPTPRGALKRQFILLRRAALQGRDPEETKYHTSFIYVRNLYPNDTNKQTFNVEGVESVVEFDIWETRPRKFFAGWSNCDFSMLFSCTSMEDIETDASERAEHRRRKRQAIGFGNNQEIDFVRRRRAAPAPAPEPLPGLTPFQSEPGYDPGIYHDLYLDFDLHRFDEMYKTEIVKAMQVEVSQLKGKVKPTEKPKEKVLTPPPRTTTTEKPKKKHGTVTAKNRKKRSPFIGGLMGGGNAKAKVEVKGSGGVKRRGGKPKDVNSRPGGGGGDFGADADADVSGGGMLGGMFGGGGKKKGKKGKKGGGGGGGPLGGLMNMAGGLTGGLTGALGGEGGGPLGGVMDMAGGLMGAATGALGGVAGAASGVLGGAAGAASGMLGGITGAASGALGGAMNMAGGLMGAATGALGGAAGAASGMLGGITGAASGALGGAMNMAGGLAGGLSGSLGGMLGGEGGGPLGGLMDMAGGLTGGLTGSLGGMLGGEGGGPLGGLLDMAGGLTGGLTGSLGGMLGGEGGGPLGGLMDMAGGLTGGLTGSLGGMLGGEGGGPLGGLMNMAGGLTGGLGGMLGGEGGGPLGGLMDMAGGLTGGLTGSLGGMLGGEGGGPLGGIMDMAGGLMGSATGMLGGAAGALSGAVGGIAGLGGSMAGMMGGALGSLTGAASMFGDVMGPASLLLGPVTGIVGAAGEMVKSVPGLGMAVGHNIIGALAPIADSMGIGKMMEAVGMGPLINTAAGIADSIISTGDMLLSTWETIGNGMIEQAAAVLVKAGVPAEVAQLAALGGQLAFNAFALTEAKAAWLGLRLGVDAAGTVMNGGRYSGKGLYGEGSVPANSVTVYGTLYPGAEGGKYFFFPQDSLLRCKFQSGDDDAGIEGWFKTSMAGGPDAFFPDGDGSQYFGKSGKILPTQYVQEDSESEPGIVGTFEEGYKFTRDGKKVTGIYKPGDPDWAQNVWLPGEIGQLTARPAKTPVGKKILYGYLFNGIEDSPHMFISEGDTVSGMFVPMDPERKEVTETPHGVLTPSHPAGHATFVADDPREVININEIRGVFMPDAMNLAGGFSGRISKAEDCNCDVKFLFTLDKPAIEFMYVPENVHVKNVWSPYLTADEWNYLPPKEPEGEIKDDTDDDDDDTPPPSRRKRSADAEKPKEVSGLKVKTKKSVSFIPEMFPFDGVLFGISNEKRYQPIAVRMILEKPDEPMKFAVIKKTDPNEVLPTPLVGLFLPAGFPKDDGFAGHLFMNEDQAGGTLKLALEMGAHFWTPGEEIWTPVGFKEKMMEGDEAAEEAKTKVQAKEEKKNEKQAKKAEELKQDQKEKEEAMAAAGKKPKQKDPAREIEEPPKRPGNLITGKLAAESAQSGSPEMTEDENENADEFVRGFYLKSNESPEPIFVPDTGMLGAFAAGGGAAKAFYFPKRGDLESLFIPQTPGSIPDGTVGQFFTLDDEDKPSKGFIVGKFNGKTLETEGMEEIPGWEMADQQPVQPGDLPKGAKVSEEYFKPSMKGLKYALVDIGGGYKGVIIGGGKALDDPNNPIFQQFLHYRATQTGDVNPFGRVAIVNPVMRQKEEGGDNEGDGFQGSFKLALGKFHEGLQANPNGILAQVMNRFSLDDWEYPDETEFEGGAKRTPNMMGTRANVVNMLDFRMFLFKKYTCKKSEVEGGKTVHMFAPQGAEEFLKFKSLAKPRAEWLDAIVQSGSTMVVPDDAGIAGAFSAQFNLDVESIAPFQRDAGEGIPAFTPGEGMKDTGDWKTSAPYLEWGDENSCDVIEMDDFMTAQTLGEMSDEASTQSSNGISLGYQLVKGMGTKVSYFKSAKKLLANYNRKMADRKEQTAEKQHAKGQTTDLTGQAEANAEVQAQKRKRQIDFYNRFKREGASDTTPAPGANKPKSHMHARSMPGWKTQHRQMKDNATLSDNGIFFYGLGNCKWEKLPDESLLKSKRPDQVIQFYLRIMRINCMEGAEKRMVELVNQGFLKLAKTGMYFDIPEENKIVHNQRLTPTEIKKMSLAFEFHAFTKTYAKRCVQEDRGRGVIEEGHGIVSRSMDFLTEMALYVINTGRRVSPTHAIRLNRNMLMTLRSVMSKLQQDHIVLAEECATCKVDKELTDGDRFRAISLSEFIIHGLLPYNMGHQKLKPLFTSFEKRNKRAILQRVQEFSRQFPDKVRKEPAKEE